MNRAARGLDVSNRDHPRPLVRSGSFDNPVVGLAVGAGIQLQTTVHYSRPQWHTSSPYYSCENMGRVIIELPLLFVTFSSMPAVQVTTTSESHGSHPCAPYIPGTLTSENHF